MTIAKHDHMGGTVAHILIYHGLWAGISLLWYRYTAAVTQLLAAVIVHLLVVNTVEGEIRA